VPGEEELRRLIRRIDGRGYKAYRDLRGHFDLADLSLHVDHVQGDPFAAPSKLRVRVSMARASLPADWYGTRVRRIALEDLLARRVRDAIERGASRTRGSGKSGVIRVDAGGQEVLERSAVRVCGDWVEVRLEVGLPAAGRRVLGNEAEALLCDDVPALARRALLAEEIPADETRAFVDCVENQEAVRAQLDGMGLVAFVADGSVLPRESGASDRPLVRDPVPFEAPEALRVGVRLAHPTEDGRTELSGLGVPKGITLIVGGGYHGKSTLLRAIERGVHPHIPGDGREWVVSAPGLVKIRAEDGRRVERVDIRSFVSDLPGGRPTNAFSSEDASGSTSQAANIVEALEAGATGLLLDEDTSATNFMVRDARMQALVHPEHEPITPFIDRVKELHQELGVSTVLVMGGCGDYFEVADTVIRMRDFRPEDATTEAHRIAAEHATPRHSDARRPLSAPPARVPVAHSFDASRGRREVKIDARSLDEILYGRETIDLRGVEQLVDRSQTRAIGHAIHLATERFMDGRRTLGEVLDDLDTLLDAEGLDVLDPFHRPGQHPGSYARPRRFEIAAAINRLRTLRMSSDPSPVRSPA
jgi:predicted ABC-class ATPase